jgi:hypothetical protein
MPNHQEETSMKRKLLSVAIAAALAFGVPITQAQQGKLSGDVVKIGVLTDMSGLYADYGGTGAVAAARLGVQDFGCRIFVELHCLKVKCWLCYDFYIIDCPKSCFKFWQHLIN